MKNQQYANETFQGSSGYYKLNHNPNWQAELTKSF